MRHNAARRSATLSLLFNGVARRVLLHGWRAACITLCTRRLLPSPSSSVVCSLCCASRALRVRCACRARQRPSFAAAPALRSWRRRRLLRARATAPACYHAAATAAAAPYARTVAAALASLGLLSAAMLFHAAALPLSASACLSASYTMLRRSSRPLSHHQPARPSTTAIHLYSFRHQLRLFSVPCSLYTYMYATCFLFHMCLQHRIFRTCCCGHVNVALCVGRRQSP